MGAQKPHVPIVKGRGALAIHYSHTIGAKDQHFDLSARGTACRMGRVGALGHALILYPIPSILQVDRGLGWRKPQ
jgi:hypothetical protein